MIGPPEIDGPTPDGQLDLFAGSGFLPATQPAPLARPPVIAPAELDDAALLAAIPASGLADGPPLAAEAGRRRLVTAVPVLEDYCRRFAGFGMSRALPEQVAALEAGATIGGPKAAESVARIIVQRWVQGPTVTSAPRPRPASDRAFRRTPCSPCCVTRNPQSAGTPACWRAAEPRSLPHSTDLLRDLHADVRTEAACALGRIGSTQAVPLLKLTLSQAPVIKAVAGVADEDCIVLLGRIAEGPAPDLAAAAVEALEAVEHPLAERRLERLWEGRC